MEYAREHGVKVDELLGTTASSRKITRQNRDDEMLATLNNSASEVRVM